MQNIVQKIVNIDKDEIIGIRAIQHDTQTRFINFRFISNNSIVDLTNCNVRIYAKTASNTEIFNNLTVIDAKKGIAQLELTDNLLVPGTTEYQLKIMPVSGGQLSTTTMQLTVDKNLMSEFNPTGTNEYKAFELALQTIDQYDQKLKDLENSPNAIYIEKFKKQDGEIDDTERLQRAIDYATANKLKLTCKGSNNFIISKALNITKPYNIDFNKATINANCETAINIDIGDSTETQSILENLNLNCLNAETGIQVNARRVFLRNLYLYNINNVGLNLKSGYEISVSYCNFKGVGKTNKAIILNTTDNYINNCFGTDNNIFIENNAEGNIISSCHAWIYNKDILDNSIFVNLNNSALVEKCVSDTYAIAFQCSTNTTSRIVNNNCIVEPTVYNKNNISEPPIFINFIGDIPIYKITISNNWIMFPDVSKTNYDVVGKFSNIDTINILGSVSGNTGNLNMINEVKTILTPSSDNISSLQSYAIRKNNRVSIKCFFAFKDSTPTTETTIFTLPQFMTPYKNMYAFGVQGTNIDNLSKPVYAFIKSSGEIIIKNATGDTTMSQGLLQCEFDIWQPGIDA